MKNNVPCIGEVLRDEAKNAIDSNKRIYFKQILAFLANVPVHPNWMGELYRLVVEGSRKFNLNFEPVHSIAKTWFGGPVLDGLSERERLNHHLARKNFPTEVGKYLIHIIANACSAEEALIGVDVIFRIGPDACVGVTREQLLRCILSASRLTCSRADSLVVCTVYTLTEDVRKTAEVLSVTTDEVFEKVSKSGVPLRRAA